MIYIVSNGGAYEDKKYLFVLVPEKYHREEWVKSVERLLVTDFYDMNYEPRILGTAPSSSWREGEELRAFADFIHPPLFIHTDEAMKQGIDYLGPMAVGSSRRTVWAKPSTNISRIPPEVLEMLVEDWKNIDNEHNRPYLPVLEVLLEKMR